MERQESPVICLTIRVARQALSDLAFFKNLGILCCFKREPVLNATVFIDDPANAEKRGEYQEKSSTGL
ncbi:Uncharacterised protein [Salmonella enterica subsp. enterica]|uniref:Uncharacterized protein n=1 Tax=Salmonella enterica I TaxID=59201 RepID=A0A3S4K670_SALET|nr:Uncharacterised protein [Salmonella enterica subsp. enterica]